MYPNPQDTLPLLSREGIVAYHRIVDALVKACHEGGDAIAAWSSTWHEALGVEVLGIRPRDMVRRIADTARYASGEMEATDCAPERAMSIVALLHGFRDWTDLESHVEALARLDSPVAMFEQAADAIVAGDTATLQHLLNTDPTLVHVRSRRAHGATLLHYVAANGVEHFRQRTPDNIVAIARVLLDAGADVDAAADVYGGGATTLGLVVTSAHPRHAGVQLGLADLLLKQGARLDNGLPRAALHNGCPEAAALLVDRGGAVGLEVAAGIGRTDLVAAHLPGATLEERVDGLLMASWYGRREVITLLLDDGLEPGAGHGTDGQTALHVAAYQGDLATVRLLLDRGAPVNVNDACYGTPPLVWALHAWLVDGRGDRSTYRSVLLALVEAGAAVQRQWIDDDQIRADEELCEHLRGAEA